MECHTTLVKSNCIWKQGGRKGVKNSKHGLLETKREQVQREACDEICKADWTGIVNISPRVGKSKILIDSIRNKTWSIVISSPYRAIQESWEKEIDRWALGYKPLIICSRSLEHIPSDIDLLVVDEVQTLSENQILVIKNKKPKRILGLTGTLSDDTADNLYAKLGLASIFDYSIDRAIMDGIISNFEIIIVECAFDHTQNSVLSGTKKKPFMTTEYSHFKYVHENFEKYKRLAWGDAHFQRLKDIYMMKRFNFIYTAKSKLDVAKRIIDKQERCIVFTARTEQASYLTTHTHHSKNKKENNLEKFINGEVDKLGVVEMINMGVTIPNLKCAVVHQMKSSSEMSLQKILRACNLEDDKVARIYVTVYKDTVDEKWMEEAFVGVDKTRIKRISGNLV